MKKPIILTLIVTMLCIFGVEASALETQELNYFEVDRLDQATESPWAMWGLDTTFGANDTSYYDQLDANGKIIYKAIDEAVTSGTVYTDEGRYYYLATYQAGGENPALTWTSEDYKSYCYGVVSAYMADHPRESVVMTGSVASYGWDSVAESGSLRGLLFYLLDDQPKARLARLDNAVNAFYADFVNDGMRAAPALEQYRYIHDYLPHLPL